MPTRRTAHRAARTAAAIATLVLVAGGCSNAEPTPNKRPHTGSGTASAVAGDIQQITLTSGTDDRFHPSTFTVRPGKVRIVLANRAVGHGGGPTHNVSFSGLPGAYVPNTPAGATQSATFVAPSPGTYRFVCTIHLEQGQTGTMIVRAGA